MNGRIVEKEKLLNHSTSDLPGGYSPAVLENILLLSCLRVFERDVEHFAEVLAEVM